MNGPPASLHFDGLFQVAYVVPNLQAAIDDWVTRLKVGPWFVSPHTLLQQKRYRGEPTNVDTATALAYWNQTNIELVEPLNDVPSIYRYEDGKGRYGFHHWGLASVNFDKDIERFRKDGYEVIYGGVSGAGGRLSFLDTTDKLPGFTELLEVTDRFTELFGGIYRASVEWDGSNPVRAR